MTSIPNGRVAGDWAAKELIESSDERLEVSALRRQLKEVAPDAVDPETCWNLAQECGYDVRVIPDHQGGFTLDIVHPGAADQSTAAASQPLLPRDDSWRTYANDPLDNGFRQQLVPYLREELKTRLPDYMIPTSWMLLKQLPLTPSGKLDRRALPDPQTRPEDLGGYAPPRTDVECALANIWTQLLQVDRVGVDDDFFALGGHSLLGMKLIAKVAYQFMVHLSPVAAFQYPNIRSMAKILESMQSTHASLPGTEGLEFEEGVIDSPQSEHPMPVCCGGSGVAERE